MGMGRGYGRGYGYGRERGYGRGSGGGRGRRRFFDPYFEPDYIPEAHYLYPRDETLTPEEEKGYLKNVLADLEDQVKVVKERIKSFVKKQKE